MLSALLKKIEFTLKQDFKNEKTGHDLKHLKRVLIFAEKIQRAEGGEKDVILISALVHDIHRILSPHTEHSTNVGVSPLESLSTVKEILIKCDVPNDTIVKVLNVVEEHDNKNNKNLNLETKIVQDADMLDAMGKTGLKRTLNYCKHKNIPIFNHTYPLDSNEYLPNLNPLSTTHYIYRTMIPHEQELHTLTSKKLVRNKITILKKFVTKQLRLAKKDK